MSDLLTDLHAPLLPGPQADTRTFAESVRRLERAHLDGIWKAVLTPGLEVGDRSAAELGDRIILNGAVLEELRRRCRDLGGIPGLSLGHQVRIRNLREAERAASVPGIGIAGTRWILVELGQDHADQTARAAEAIRELRRAGFQVLVAHPEQHPLRRRPDPLIEIRRWHDAGAALQVGAGSLDGIHGRDVARLAWHLIEEDLVHVVASGHSASRRPHLLRAAARRLAFRWSPREALRLAATNPRRILRNMHRANLVLREEDAGVPAGAVPEPTA